MATHGSAPTPGTALCAIEAVPDGGCKELCYGSGDDAFRLLLYRQGEHVVAYVNCCPHFYLPLNTQPDHFFMLEGARLMCAWHCAVFRLEDGYCVEGPAQGLRLERIAVSTKAGKVVLGGEPHGE